MLRRPDAPGAPVNRDELRAVQIDGRPCRARAGDGEARRTGLRAKRQRARRRGRKIGEDEREGFDSADISRLKLQHERTAERLCLNIRDRCRETGVVPGGTDGLGAGERGTLCW